MLVFKGRLDCSITLRTSALFVSEKSLFLLCIINREFRKSFSVGAKEVIITQVLQMAISSTGKSNAESSLSAAPYIYYIFTKNSLLTMSKHCFNSHK